MQSYAHNNQVTPPNSDYVDNIALVANAPQTIVWPTNAAFVNFNFPQNYFVSTGTLTVVPSANITNGTGAALNPSQRQRGQNETQFTIISMTSQLGSLEFWGS
jgi:hypothetical protein